jgi:tetratricopeptide (TPR) repeat protein
VTTTHTAPPPETIGTRPTSRPRREEPSTPTDDGERDPAASRQYVAAGKAAYLEGRYGPARSAFERALAADPRNVAALDGLTATVFEMSRYEDVVYFGNRASHAGSRNPQTYQLLGMASARLGRLSDALRAYNKAKQLDPSLPVDGYIKDIRSKMDGR